MAFASGFRVTVWFLFDVATRKDSRERIGKLTKYCLSDDWTRKTGNVAVAYAVFGDNHVVAKSGGVTSGS